ncbi:hypothetical protein O6H91_05G036500 [Diphasiastrum complanatum]|uniref:Uncharacterized protein n=1 Tax=Diphasiastrum complanatum TaxID=34168 RepID=A0ACC2DM97_DIPCM|nr:hypothetical protein O6H91_05G036500 [Diphasiastrum complanatum]
MDEEDEEWDLAAIDELEKKAQEANAARRASQAYPSLHTNPFSSRQQPAPSPAASFLTPHFYSAETVKPTGVQSSNARNPSPHPAESQKLHEVLLEKEGAISLLRSRLKQTEQDLYEIRRRVSTQTLAQPTSQQQQRELEHLSSQLMFKDQEILEVKRACVEKEERLKSVLDTAAALRQEVETLKRKREIGRKPCQGVVEAMNYLESKEPLSGLNSEKNNNTQGACKLIGNRSQNLSKELHDQWIAPWSSQKVFKVPPDIPSQKQLKDPPDMPIKFGSTNSPERKCSDLGISSSNTASAQMETFEFPILDERDKTSPLANGGCATSNDKSTVFSCNGIQAHELTTGEPIVASRHKFTDREYPTRAQVLIKNSESLSENDEGISHIADNMSTIWRAKDTKEAGCDLVAKLFAYCQPQLHMLLKFDGSQNPVEQKSYEEEDMNYSLWFLNVPNNKGILRENTVSEDGSGVSLKLHNALALVSNGLSSTVTLLGPLIEYCCCVGKAQLVQSSMCLLSCIVQHDRCCREKLLGRTSSYQLMEMGENMTFSQKLNVRVKGSGWLITAMEKFLINLPLTLTDQVTDSGGLYFASPRITCHLNQGVKNGMKVHSPNTVLDGQSYHQAGSCVEESESKDTVVQANVGNACDPCFFLRWALHLAITSTIPGIRYETVTLMRLLLMHTEPLTERAQFASLLFKERLFLLLKKGAGVHVQLQTLRLVHLLLHCPDILKKVCKDGETKKNVDISASARGQKGYLKSDPRFVDVAAMGEKLEKLDKIEQNFESRFCGEAQLEVIGHCTDLLEGLSACISFTGVSLQEYALRRGALRVLAFIATSGDNGPEFLLQDIAVIDTDDGGRPTKECQQGGQMKAPPHFIGERACDERLDPVSADSKDPSKRSPASGPVLTSDRKVTDTRGRKEQGYGSQNIPSLLVTLINSELLVEEEEQMAATSTQRGSLIREALTLLCRLASHTIHSSVVVALLTRDKCTLRTGVNVMNRLIRLLVAYFSLGIRKVLYSQSSISTWIQVAGKGKGIT